MMANSDTTPGIKFAILTVDLPESNAITQHVISKYPSQVTGVIRSRSLQGGKRTWEALRQLVPRSGPLMASKALESAVSHVVAPAMRLMGRVPRTAPLRQITSASNIPLRSTADINSSSIRQLLASWQTELIVSIYMNQILKRELLNSMPLGAINVHPSLLPKHRGLFPYVWAMGDDDRKTGVTVHWMDENIDTGAIIQQQSTPILVGECMVSLAHRCADIASGMLVEAIDSIQRGEAHRLEQQADHGSYHGWPDRACLRRCRKNQHPCFRVARIWRELSRAA